MWLQGQHQTQARSIPKHLCFFLPLNPNGIILIFPFFLIPGGGDVKIESHKLNIKAKSKIGSMDNVGAGNGQTNGQKVTLKHS